MVGLANEEFIVGGKREAKGHPYEILSEAALRLYDLKKAARIDIPCDDPMKLDLIANALESLAQKLRRLRLIAADQPPQITAVASISEVRATNQIIKAITKGGATD